MLRQLPNVLTSVWTPIVIVGVSGALPGGSAINLGLYAASLIFSVVSLRHSLEPGWWRPRVGVVDPSDHPGNGYRAEARRALDSIRWLPILWFLMAIRVIVKKPEQEDVGAFVGFAAACCCLTAAVMLMLWVHVRKVLAEYHRGL